MTTALAILAFTVAALGLLGINVSWYRALKNERRETHAWRNTAISLRASVVAIQAVFEETEAAEEEAEVVIESNNTLFLPELDWVV